MRLTVSLCLWLAVATASVLGIHGWFQLRKEESDLEQAARREITLLATAIRTGVESAMRDNQAPDIDALLEQLERRDPELDVFVFNDKKALVSSSWGSAPNLPRARAMLSGENTESMKLQTSDEADFFISSPIRVKGELVGDIVLIRPRTALLADLSEERQSLVLSMVLVVLTLTLTLSLVVHLRLHRPLNQIVRGVRSLARGEYAGSLAITGKDEISQLAREFEFMSKALEQSRNNLLEAAESRERLQAEMLEINRLALVGQLAAGLAHEIGSPLQVLNGRARLLAHRDDLPQQARRNAEILVEQTDRISNIVERLLSLSRRKPLNPSLIQLVEPIEKVVELLTPQAQRQGVALRLHVQDTPSVLADGGQVQQIVLNLLQNALSASSKGGCIDIVLRTCFCQPPASNHEQRTVCIAVEDEGMGVEESLLPRIFDPLVTAWSAKSTNTGTGLGLSVVKAIVSEHGGWVYAESAPSGKGTRFVVHFPMGEESKKLVERHGVPSIEEDA